MVKLKEFLGKDIHPDFTEKDEDIYYLKKEVDKKIKEIFKKIEKRFGIRKDYLTLEEYNKLKQKIQ